MNITIDTILAIAIGIAAYMVFFNIVTAGLGAFFEVPIERIQFGYPPSFRLFRIGKTEVRVSPLFFGGHVKFALREGQKHYAPWQIRALLAIAPLVLAIVVCAIVLGPQVLDEIAMAMPQLWAVLTDYSAPVNLNDALAPTFDKGGLLAAMAVVVVKVVMFSLIPLPITNGGTFLIALFEGLTGKSTEHFIQKTLMVSLIVWLGVPTVLLLRIAMGT